jgi:negative regulator of flagellin synthesis FlgM
MDINNNTLDVMSSLLGINQAQAVKKTQATSPATAVAASAVFDGDQAQVSAAGTEAASATSDVRTEKVAEIQAAINAGTYNVSSAAVASKLVSVMLGE